MTHEQTLVKAMQEAKELVMTYLAASTEQYSLMEYRLGLYYLRKLEDNGISTTKLEGSKAFWNWLKVQVFHINTAFLEQLKYHYDYGLMGYVHPDGRIDFDITPTRLIWNMYYARHAAEHFEIIDASELLLDQ